MILRNLSVFVLAYLASAAVIAMFRGLIAPPSWIVLSMGGLGIVLGTLQREVPSTKSEDSRRSDNAGANHSV
jgi:hypothetical protein